MATVSATALIAMLALGLGAPGPARPSDFLRVALDSADVRAWLDSLVPPALRDGDLPGALVVVVHDGRVLIAEGYGFADVAARIPMDPARTVVQVGSVSKLFTWTAVMQQVEAGRLSLDRDVNAGLDFTVPPAFGQPITLRHLMTHTAGFEERVFRQYERPRALAEHLRGTPVPERIFPPGQVVAYSNYGSMVAGYLVERVSGEAFVDYVEHRILRPLGMTRSTFRRPLPGELAADLARSYGQASEPALRADALDREEPSGDPSGHLATTGADIARFMLAHLQHGTLDSVRILDSTTVSLMHAPVIEPVPGALPLTLGFFRADRNGRRVLGHGGDIEGFHADLQLVPDERLGFFFLVNGSGTGELLGAGHQLRTRMFRRFMDRFFPGGPLPTEPTTATALEHARMVAGEYQMSRRGSGDFVELQDLLTRATFRLRIRANDDGTIVTPPLLDFEHGREQTWREVGPFVWREVGGTERLVMRVDDGRVTAWIPEHVSSMVMQPVPAVMAALPNVVLLGGTVVVLTGAVMGWIATLFIRRLAGRSLSAAWRPIGLAALLGLVYLLGWAALLVTGTPTREGGEIWIRVVQVVGILALGGALLSIRGLRLVREHRAGVLATGGALLVVAAMAEIIWLSFGFQLLSWRLIY